jgi:hypothetical protein
MIVCILLSLLSLLSSSGHVVTIPYPYYNREYAVRMTKNIFVNESSFDYNYSFSGNSWEIVCNAVSFIRHADRGFSMYGGNKRLATVFHGSDYFDVSDMYPGSQIMYVDHESPVARNFLSPYQYIKYEGLVMPQYTMQEYGFNLAADIVKKINEKTTFLIQLRLPIVQQNICHESKWNDIEFNDTRVHDKRLYLDDLNHYFKARNDYLYENDIIPKLRTMKEIKNQKGISFLDNDDQDYFLKKECYYSPQEEPSDNFHIIYSYEDLVDLAHKSESKSIDTAHWYAFTEFDEMSMPTLESLHYFDKIMNSRSRKDALFYGITKGTLFNKDFSWSSVARNYIAPCDIQLNIASLLTENIILQGLVSFVLPIQGDVEKDDNYIEKGFFKDCYAIRLGGQLECDLSKHYKVVGYGSWQYYFPSLQSVPAIFEGVNAFGLTPFYINANVSWYEWYLAGHIVIKYNDYIGVDLGYQYINKSGDTVSPACSQVCLIDGQSYTLNYADWSKFSHSVSKLLAISGYYYYKSCQCELGARGVISGSNSMQIKEYFIRVGIDF